MVKNQHKLLCIILCLALALSAVVIGTTGAFAASGDKVYVKANNGWTDLHCYMWSGSGSSQNAEWPGVAMTNVSGDVYCYTLAGDYEKVIFNKGMGGSGNQTDDLTYPGANKIYDLSTGQWSDYSGSGDTDPTQGHVENPTAPPSGGITVYFKNTPNWSNVKCYMWNGTGTQKNAEWPGVAMQDLGDGIFSYTSTTAFENCIFNGNGDQTPDLQAKDGYMFDYGTNQWTPYDTSAIRVTSCTADPDGEVYVGAQVTISAEATSAAGKVYYKFSVTNASGGDSVISDFSTANKANWTPSQPGSYKLTVNFKDDGGNENSREISVTVKSDSGVAAPILKNVTPADQKLIKKDAATTVNVEAGGGQTGTNLLFYKYIVTDPNGVQNTPYYTLSKSYSFTPKLNGKHTVEVFVQSSDNTTISKTYTYTATDADIPTDPQPVTIAPVTDPTQTPTQTPTQSPTVKPQDPTEAPTTVPGGDVYKEGDADGDGITNIKDATFVQKYVAEYPEAIANIKFKNADMDKNNRINIVDATLIQIYLNQ